MSENRAVARAIDALRRGWPVAIGAGETRLLLLAIETADGARLGDYDPDGTADLLISHPRATTLDLADTCAADVPVRIARPADHGFAAAMAIADPAHDLASPLKGPLHARASATPEAEAAMRLARLAGLLPAFFARTTGEAEVALSAEQVAGYESPDRLAIVARARLPITAATDAEIVAFRSIDDAREHIALLLGAPGTAPPLVRLHSECLTGDVLGSLKCDCGPQLHVALHALGSARRGILLYLRQEGRGIGLVNKLRAYGLQDDGFDTVDANTRLGFAPDSRDFATAARMLALLGEREVRLLTNNPAKVAGLAAAGIRVVERVPHAIQSNPHNAGYLDAKRRRAGHLL